MTIPQFQKHILDWYALHKRDLPWRNTRNPYHILVSEIMLQQTQVSRVLPKYEQFLKKYPTTKDLAQADNSDLLEIWSGLGYWRRARFLREAAREITEEHGGKFPQQPKELQRLAGIGPYTAGALACFAFQGTDAFIDTNIRRVYLHFFFQDKENVSDKEILAIAQKAVYAKDPCAWHYALFDYGATELKNKKINRKSKHYAKQSPFAGSFRSYRAKAIKHILTLPKHAVSEAELLDYLEDQLRAAEHDYSPRDIIDALLKDKLIKKQNGLLIL